MNLSIFLRLSFFCFLWGLLWACDEEKKPKSADIHPESGKMIFHEIPSWMGSYQDTLPCEDCPGVLTRIDFKSDSTYKKSIIFLGKEPIFDHTFSTTGRWFYRPKERLLFLDSSQEKKVQAFEIVGDTLLKMCDTGFKAHTSPSYWLPRVM
jgi:uncharacterized lipoprotein NlpE involved in copper resistance